MSNYQLVVEHEDGAEESYPVGPEGLTIGRMPGADIRLERPQVSRCHARVWEEDGVLMVEDLKSRNGVGVDRRRVHRAALIPGQELVVGSVRMQVRGAPGVPPRSSVITPQSARRLHETIVAERSPELLLVLYRSARLLGTVFDLDELLGRILEMIFEAVPARRGFILTLTATGEAEVRAERHREGGSSRTPMSETLLRQVLERKEAVLTPDARQDMRFEGSDSIVGHAIGGAMCAPLCGRQSVVGALYVDTGSQTGGFRDADLEVLAVIGQVVGVAVENARLYQENLERERLAAIGEATAGIGHCMKNLLMGVAGAGEFIEKALRDRDLDWLEKGWNVMRGAIQRHEALVLNLLSFSRDYSPLKGMAHMNSIVHESLALLEPTARKQGVEFAFIPGEGPETCFDARAMHRVVMNLLTNAVDACQEGGRVSVATRHGGRGWTLRVEDNGAGIPPDVLPRIGKAFYTTKGSQGTGLGLATSLKVVRAHGGDICFESEEGEGTVCTVRVPDG